MRPIQGRGPVLDWPQRVRNSQAFVGFGTQAAVAAVASQVQCFNPAASGRYILVKSIWAYVSVAQDLFLTFYNVAHATLAMTGVCAKNGGTAALGQVRTDTNAAILGTQFRRMAAAAGLWVPLHNDLVCELSAGQGVNVSQQGVNALVTAAFEWVEVTQ